jgi:membrane-associated phospholipid phosphatase
MSENGDGRRDQFILLGTVCLFAAALGVMAAADLYAFMWKTVVVPLVVIAALLSRRAGKFIDDWAVFLGLVIFFDFCRGFVFALITRFDLPVYMAYVIDWEHLLCGGTIFPVVLQELRALLPAPGVVDRFLTVVHGLHFAYFLLFGLALWLVKPQAFRRYAVAMVLLMYAGLAFYLLVPTVPPWMASDYYGMIPPIQHVSVEIYNLALPTLQEAFDINPVAAMPSLHTALPVLCAAIGVHEFGRRALPLFAWAALVVLAIVYLGEHYLIDALAGGLLAAAVYFVVYRVDLPVLRQPLRMPRVHPVLMSALLITVAEGVGELTIRMQQPWQASRSFVEREMVGRSELAPLLLGRIALNEGRLDEARRLLAEATHTVADPGRRRQASLGLAQAAYRQRDFGSAIGALEPDQRGGRLGRQAQILLAVAYLNDGHRKAGEDLLESLAHRYANDPEPLYWLTKYRYAHQLVAREDVLLVATRMETFRDKQRADTFRRSLLRLVGQSEADLPDS